jgi:hypothetical protein
LIGFILAYPVGLGTVSVDILHKTAQYMNNKDTAALRLDEESRNVMDQTVTLRNEEMITNCSALHYALPSLSINAYLLKNRNLLNVQAASRGFQVTAK